MSLYHSLGNEDLLNYVCFNMLNFDSLDLESNRSLIGTKLNLYITMLRTLFFLSIADFFPFFFIKFYKIS